jgi:hypothetical protein
MPRSRNTGTVQFYKIGIGIDKILTEISDHEKENKCRGWKWSLKVYADQMNISSAIFK